MRRGDRFVASVLVALAAACGSSAGAGSEADGGGDGSSIEASAAAPETGVDATGAMDAYADAALGANDAPTANDAGDGAASDAGGGAASDGYDGSPPGDGDTGPSPSVADNPPVPAGYKPMMQSEVTPDMTAWAVSILDDPTTYPMFATATKTFDELTVLARVEWQPPDFQNSVVHRGVTLYEPI
jgi:hypothetical protein